MSAESNLLVVPIDPSGAEYLSFAPAYSGWAIYVAPEYAYGSEGLRRLFVRFAPADSSEKAKIVAREVHVAFTESLGGRALRDLPLAKLEAAVNQPAYYDAVRQRLQPKGIVMDWIPGGQGDWLYAKPPAATPPNLRLTVPGGRPKPDDFYEQVATVFAYLTTVSTRPANEMAEANGVRTTTVHGWVKEARKRGFLASGERSRRGLVEIVKDGESIQLLGVHRPTPEMFAQMRDELGPGHELTLRQVARTYRVAEVDGHRNPTAVVASDFGISDADAEAWVTRARAEGYFDSLLIEKRPRSGGQPWQQVAPPPDLGTTTSASE